MSMRTVFAMFAVAISLAGHAVIGDAAATGASSEQLASSNAVGAASSSATVSDAQLFAWAVATYPTLFSGTPTSGTYQTGPYDIAYNYYPNSFTYLGVDSVTGIVYVLGPVTDNVAIGVGVVSDFAPSVIAWEAASTSVAVSGVHLVRNGVPWNPHGAQIIAFVAPPAAQTGYFSAAHAHYSTAELSAVKAWGADTIRFQISQPGLDPQSSLYDASFLGQIQSAVAYARSIGLNVIVCVQDEAQSGETCPSGKLA